ncbi:hypothetical protein [Gemmatimonas groenlandica]|uniref:Serine protease n=1 Tax=Gemmatimonas groenlandica TaxID=2732249 RepID=A0A6M4ITC3_9BACT|nr:hypothetical protein [Gemmatimonas groenlandica]QJR37983.1 hypothetical protein HKW67_21860 [Gemmatimonas groenlandica]
MAVLMLAACGDATTARVTAPSEPDALQFARSEQAQARLASLYDGASAEVLAVDGSVFADHDERLGKLVFGVERLSAAAAVQAAAARAGVAASDFVIVLSAPIKLLGGHVAAGAPVHSTSSTSAPVVAGVAIGTAKYHCTLGFNVAHAAGRSFITNSHCTDRQGVPDKTQFWQPQVGAGRLIGVEDDDPTYTANKACPKDRRCRYSDAARIAYLPDVPSRQGEVATSATVTELFTRQDDLNNLFLSGNLIYKTGMTTGTTTGSVSNSCANANVEGTNLTLICQTFVTGAAGVVGFGDSGAPAYRKAIEGNVLLGIVWGGVGSNTFVFSPLEGIVRDLGRMSAVVGGTVSTTNGNGK